MKIIALFLTTILSVQAAPTWVPEKYKRDFDEMERACTTATTHAAEFAEVLRSTSKVDGCEVKDKGVLFRASRGSVKVEWYQEFSKVVKSCEYSGGEMTIVFTGQDTEGQFMKALKYTAIIVGSVGLGFLLGGVK